jgi:hypothetical protein
MEIKHSCHYIFCRINGWLSAVPNTYCRSPLKKIIRFLSFYQLFKRFFVVRKQKLEFEKFQRRDMKVWIWVYSLQSRVESALFFNRQLYLYLFIYIGHIKLVARKPLFIDASTSHLLIYIYMYMFDICGWRWLLMCVFMPHASFIAIFFIVGQLFFSINVFSQLMHFFLEWLFFWLGGQWDSAQKYVWSIQLRYTYYANFTPSE